MSDDSDSDSSSEELDLDVSMSEDERNMGIPGGSYTDSDLRLLARWFSTQEPDWTISGATASFAEQASHQICKLYHHLKIYPIVSRKIWSFLARILQEEHIW